jgi:hypothetical protein
VKQYKRAELFLLFFGGALLILHAIAICVRVATGIPSEQITSTNNIAILIGQIAVMLCFLGLVWGCSAWHGKSAVQAASNQSRAPNYSRKRTGAVGHINSSSQWLKYEF